MGYNTIASCIVSKVREQNFRFIEYNIDKKSIFSYVSEKKSGFGL